MIGARLKQARLLAGMTQRELAKALGNAGYSITAAAISKYEKEKSYPPVRFLLLAGRELDVPSTYFSHQPQMSVQWTAFRRHSKFGMKQRESLMAYASDLAELQIELHSLLYPDASPDIPRPVPVCGLDEAEDLALSLRERWDLGNRPLDNLVQTSEDRGVVVIGWDDQTGNFDGLSGWCNAYPIAVINTNRSTDRIRFSLAHEIGHLVMDTMRTTEDEEKLANRFAAAFLVPRTHALHELGHTRHHLDWSELKLLKRKYGLSMAAWIGRARDLGIITENYYRELNIERSALGWRTVEPVDYLGDEEPIQLKQMASRAVAEGLISPDRITSVCKFCLESKSDLSESTHLTVRDLLKMSEEQRNEVMERAFALASEDDFEVFDADDLYDFEEYYDQEAVD